MERMPKTARDDSDDVWDAHSAMSTAGVEMTQALARMLTRLGQTLRLRRCMWQPWH